MIDKDRLPIKPQFLTLTYTVRLKAEAGNQNAQSF